MTQRLIVFDCDGTLVDSQHLIVRAMQLAFDEFGLAGPSRSSILRTVGLSIPEAMFDLLPNEPFEIREKVAQAYRDWNFSLRETSEIQEPMFKGAKALVLSLASREDVLLGIATGKSRRGVNRFIEQNDLGGVFLTVQTAEDAPSKPHPGMLLNAMRDVGQTPSSTVMIGDTTYDMVMAVRAGVAGIGVSWGHHDTVELTLAGAREIVETVDDLSRLLRHAPVATAHAAAA